MTDLVIAFSIMFALVLAGIKTWWDDKQDKAWGRRDSVEHSTSTRSETIDRKIMTTINQP